MGRRAGMDTGERPPQFVVVSWDGAAALDGRRHRAGAVPQAGQQPGGHQAEGADQQFVDGKQRRGEHGEH
ncbi:hypothetical protein, partial [Streptomyces hainanensis]|uniref:hypothetical protein n=1 Tax=Streptomyces hainanensis TaxID=402648 RepID=UPI001A9DCF76